MAMIDDRMTPTPVRFPAKKTGRVVAISKSKALSQASVLRLAINQWFEAGGDKSASFAPAKKSAKKVAPKGRGKQGK
ncbi:MAG: hypothetical protein ACK49J_11035 [Verrucomicrobiota bacterium]